MNDLFLSFKFVNDYILSDFLLLTYLVVKIAIFSRTFFFLLCTVDPVRIWVAMFKILLFILLKC